MCVRCVPGRTPSWFRNTRDGFPVTELNQHHAYDLNILYALVRYIRREKIDIIHTHLLAADVMGRMAGFITRRPVVSTIHNGRIDSTKTPGTIN